MSEAERATDTTLELSVVVPAYNEARRIDRTLTEALRYLAGAHPRFELLVVDDGSTDDTRARCDAYALRDARVRVLSLAKNRGKGAAVRTGVLASRGLRVLFMDADLATPMRELEKLVAEADRGADVVLGSRALAPGWRRRRQSALRAHMGRVFNALVQGVLYEGVFDTQCGFKLFSGVAARALFSRARVDRYAFDVELLLLARELGLCVREVGVEWNDIAESRVSPVRDAARMLVDVLQMRLRRRPRAGDDAAESERELLRVDGDVGAHGRRHPGL